MKLYLRGLKFYQLDLGLECNAFTDLRLERVLQGIKRNYSEPDRRERTPLTRPHLLLILYRIGNSGYDDLVLRAAFTLAFAASLGVGEFTYRQTDLESGPASATRFLLRVVAGSSLVEITWNSPSHHPKRTRLDMVFNSRSEPATIRLLLLLI